MALRELAVAPAAYQHTCTVASGETWDPTTVTAGVVEWLNVADNTTGEWSCTLSGASASSVVLTHVLQSGDLPEGSAGEWRFRPRLTLPSGTIYCAVVQRRVKGRFEP